MTFPSIRIEGAILSGELLSRLDSADFRGQKAADFGFDSPSRLKEEIVRAWTDAHAFWKAFQRRVETLKEGATGATETRNQWVIPLLGLLGYSELEYQQQAELIGDKPFRISHRLRSHGAFPIHIVGARESLDRKPESGTGPRVSPHAHAQEYLNLKGVLFALVTNGRLLRLLRDSTRLVKLSYVEFDLDRIFSEELFADFAVLYRLLHVSRLPKSPEHAAESLLERYHQDALESGARIRDGLRVAVEQAIRELGTGFLARTPALQTAVAAGTLAPRDFYHGLLRLLFLMTAEERGLLFPRDADPRKRRIYETHYSLARLRRLAERRHMVEPGKGDLWLGLCSTFRLFVEESAGAPLGLTALCGHLFSSDSLGPLCDAALDNATLLSALAPLSVFRDRETGQRVRVNYGALATEEFGSVYESLLELHPVLLDGTPPRFTFKQAAGNERKTTGSYYTPSSLVECLLDSALDPVVEQRLAGKKGADAEQAILLLNVCDPAVGSGHFLIAAGHRLARRLATIRAGDDEPSPEQLRHALREVIGNCLYGVDVNPMSVELCKVTLWLEATEPGKPLSFLDHHIQCGNSLLGATPRVIADGLPDDAFKPIEGDDKTVCAEAKKRNKSERQQLALFHGTETAPWERLGNFPAAMLEVGTMSDDTAAALHRKEQRYAELLRSTGYLHSRFLADAWCAAFVWKKTRDLPHPITNDVLRKIERNPHDCAPWMRDEIERLRDSYQFFHWHLAFPEVFPVPEKSERPANEHAGWNGGFDVLIGNPPWERIQVEAIQFFASRRPEFLQLKRSDRDTAISKLEHEEPLFFAEWLSQRRSDLSTTAFLKAAGVFPLSTQGNINSYAVFLELATKIVAQQGRCGLVLQSGIATDDNTKLLFQSLVNQKQLVSLLSFENEEFLFPGVHHSMRFCLLTAAGIGKALDPAQFIFYARQTTELANEARRFTLSAEDIALLNPNTLTCPIFRTKDAAKLCLAVYHRFPVLVKDTTPNQNPWSVSIRRMFDMAYDSHLFRSRNELEGNGLAEADFAEFAGEKERWLRLYEAKMMHQFDHRFASFGASVSESECDRVDSSEKQRADKTASPRFWVDQAEHTRKMVTTNWSREWVCAFREIARATDERTVIAAILPKAGVGHTCYTVTFEKPDTRDIACFLCNSNSLVFDWIARQKLPSTHLSVFVLKQLPILAPAAYVEPCAWAGQPAVPLRDWLLPRVLELTYTAWDLEPFARDSGWFGPPFMWDEARRFQLRCELDAAFLHLYGLGRDNAAYILDTFPVVRRRDEATHGTYRTRDTILALYDQFAECQRTGTTFVSPLDPPPGNIRACHPPRLASGSAGEPGEESKVSLSKPQPSGPMNPILIPPETALQKVPLSHGSGRYYARFSQAEHLSERPGELYPAIWVLEAFDRAWFEGYPLPTTPDGLADYYTQARLFVLELKVEMPGHWRLEGLSVIHRADDDDSEPEDWFLIMAEPLGRRALNEGEVSITIYPNLYAAGIPASLVEAGPVDSETSARLTKAVSTAHIPDATEQEVDNALAGVAGASIEWVVAYDVGQGNSIGLCEPGGSVKAYFDLGGGVNGNAFTFPTALTHFCFTLQPPIILSHWDFDHWSSANRDKRSHGMTWIAPRQSIGPTHLALMTSIMSAGTLLLLPTGFAAKWRGQLYLELCTGKGRNHSGLAMTLSEQSSGGGEQMLFPGDARYTYIPSFPNPPTSQYLSVVVPHHGGDMRSHTVPTCPSKAASRLVYSYGPNNTFKHPRKVTRTDHDTAGWLDPLITTSAAAYEVRNTETRGTPSLGHVLLGWKPHTALPALKCGGASCQLESQQL